MTLFVADAFYILDPAGDIRAEQEGIGLVVVVREVSNTFPVVGLLDHRCIWCGVLSNLLRIYPVNSSVGLLDRILDCSAKFSCYPSRQLQLVVSRLNKPTVDSFKSGVDSPDNIASLTIQVPATRRTSAGTVVSVCCLTVSKVSRHK